MVNGDCDKHMNLTGKYHEAVYRILLREGYMAMPVPGCRVKGSMDDKE